MKNFLTRLVRLRNTTFSLDHNVTSNMLISFFFSQCVSLLRGLKVAVFLKRPRYMLRGKRVEFKYLHKIHWGPFLKLGNDVLLNGLAVNGIKLGKNVSIGSFSQIIASTTLNKIGDGITLENSVGIGEFAYLGGAGGLTIGANCIIGQYFSCHPENHHFSNLNELIKNQGVSRKGITIGPNCWIGSKVSILDGVEVGEGSVIAAGSVVTKSFPAQSVIAGVPAKLIKERK